MGEWSQLHRRQHWVEEWWTNVTQTIVQKNHFEGDIVWMWKFAKESHWLSPISTINIKLTWLLMMTVFTICWYSLCLCCKTPTLMSRDWFGLQHHANQISDRAQWDIATQAWTFLLYFLLPSLKFFLNKLNISINMIKSEKLKWVFRSRHVWFTREVQQLTEQTVRNYYTHSDWSKQSEIIIRALIGRKKIGFLFSVFLDFIIF